MNARTTQRRGTVAAVAATTDHRHAASAFIAGAAGTVIAGAFVQIVVVPTTDVSVDRWSYPWETGPFVAISMLYVLLHLLVAVGLVAFGRSGVAGTSRSARIGIAAVVAGTVMLTVGELVGIPIRDAVTDDTGAQVVGAVFGLGVLLSAVGFLVLGTAMWRERVWHGWRRCAALATGVWGCVLLVVPVAIPEALPGGVAVFGVGLLAMAVMLRGASPEHSPDQRS